MSRHWPPPRNPNPKQTLTSSPRLLVPGLLSLHSLLVTSCIISLLFFHSSHVWNPLHRATLPFDPDSPSPPCDSHISRSLAAMPSTTFADMPTLASTSHTPPPPFHRRRKSWARKIERCCCNTFAYFPLVFIYGLTTWAVWVEVSVSFIGTWDSLAYLRGGLGVVLYLLANISYTIAVFTDPGSPQDPRWDASAAGARKGGGYEGLPSYEDEMAIAENAGPQEWGMSTVTAKSSGEPRFCKKCKNVKPDRTHHCSTCGKCVLKMDHHCPWLATCVGLRNYKAFMLFLIYTSVFCWLCFAVSGWWTWMELVDGRQMEEGMRVVNTIMLAVLSGIIGLVLSGFTGWHLYLVVSGQTTIESLEKTRYLSPLRKSMERQLQQGRNYLAEEDGITNLQSNDDQPLAERLKEIHANALPGVLRPEEGESSREPSRGHTPIPPAMVASGSSPAHHSLRRSYASLEAQRERERYNSYLDEQDSEKMPNAFDVGWKRNVLHVFGNKPIWWFLPICNTSGDGWLWEVSPKWTEARERIGQERRQREREEAHWNQPAQSSFQPPPRDLRWTPGQGFIDRAQNAPQSGTTTMQMQPLDRRKPGSPPEADGYETSSDEERLQSQQRSSRNAATTNWNDIPDDFLASKSQQGSRSRSRGRQKGD